MGKHISCYGCVNELWASLKHPVERIEILNVRLEPISDSFTVEEGETRSISHFCTNSGFSGTVTCSHTLSSDFIDSSEQSFEVFSQSAVALSKEATSETTSSSFATHDVSAHVESQLSSVTNSIGIEMGLETSFSKSNGFESTTSRARSHSSNFGLKETEGHKCSAILEITPRTTHKLTLTMTQKLVKARMLYDVKYHFYAPPNGEPMDPQIFYGVEGEFEYTSTIVCTTRNLQDIFIPPG